MYQSRAVLQHDSGPRLKGWSCHHPCLYNTHSSITSNTWSIRGRKSQELQQEKGRAKPGEPRNHLQSSSFLTCISTRYRKHKAVLLLTCRFWARGKENTGHLLRSPQQRRRLHKAIPHKKPFYSTGGGFQVDLAVGFL